MNTKQVVPPVTEDISIGSTLGHDDGIDLNDKAMLQQNLTEEEIEKQKRMEEYKEELNKIQEDIATLRLVLNDKLKRENELKNLLGISFVEEMKQDFTEGFNTIKSTTAFQKTADTFSTIGSTVTQNEVYQKTTAGLKTATQKITPTFQGIGSSMKNSIGNLRNSSMFKSIESTFSTGKMKSSQSEFNIDSNATDKGGMTSSYSTLGTTNLSNGVTKHDTIQEDKN